MRTPSWVELVGRNLAAETLWVSGRMSVYASDDDPVSLDFWHGPQGRWRVEDAGTVLYLAEPDKPAVMRVHGEMRELRGDFHTVHFDTEMSPMELLGADSVLHHLSVKTYVSPDISMIAVDDRPTWTAKVAQSPSAMEVGEIGFDDATGLIVRMSTSTNDAVMEVSELVEYGSLPPETFRWVGDASSSEDLDGNESGYESDADDRDPEDPGTDGASEAQAEVLAAYCAALEHPHDLLDVIIGDADPDDRRAEIRALLHVGDVGVDALMSMSLSRFTPTAADGLRRELAELRRHLDAD